MIEMRSYAGLVAAVEFNLGDFQLEVGKSCGISIHCGGQPGLERPTYVRADWP